MTTIRTLLRALSVAAVASLSWTASAAGEPLRVVASFTILQDMVRQVGGDRVSVTSLVGADADVHSYRPRPADVRAISEAGLLVVNGLGFEGWMDRLVEASGYAGAVVVATAGIAPLGAERNGHGTGHRGEDRHGEDRHGEAGHDHEEAGHGHGKAEHRHGKAGHDHEEAERRHEEAEHHHHGDTDPHAWHDLANAARYVRNIADGLVGADPAGRAAYRAGAERYLARIAALDAEIRARILRLPPERRKVVTAHDAFGHFTAAYGIAFHAPVGPTPGIEPSAAAIARLIRQIREERITAVFLENMLDRRLIDRIAEQTGTRIGGVLHSDALSGPDGPAPTYLDLMRHNVRTLMTSLDG